MNKCGNTKHQSYALYGAFGVRVCDEWKDIGSFIKDMHPKPPGTSLALINLLGNFEPDNCRWATSKSRRDNTYETFQGQTKTATEWAKQYNINPSTLHKRLNAGWDIQTALTTPVRSKETQHVHTTSTTAA